MRNVKWLVAATALSLVMASGCKKDEPAADKPAAGEKKGADKGATDKGADKGAADKPGEKPAAAVDPNAGKPAPAVAGGEGLWGLNAPENVVALASMPGFDKAFATVKAKADKYGMALPMTKDAVLTMVQGALKLKSMDWFAADKAVHAVVLDPKTFEQGVFVLVPITGKDKLTAALGETKKDDEGNELSMVGPEGTVYLNFVDGYVVATSNAKAFAAGKDFLTRVAAKYTPQNMVEVRVAAANLRKIFADEIKGAKAQLDGLKPMLTKQLQDDMPIPGLTGLDKIFDFYMEIANAVIDESESVSFAIDLDDKGNASIPFGLTFKKDGTISKFSSSMAGANLGFVATAPASSYLVFGGQMDPKAFDSIMGYATDMVAGLLKLNEEEKKTLKTSMDSLYSLQDGKSWASVYGDGKFPLAIASESGVSDGKAYKKAMDAYIGLLFGKAMGMAKEFMPPQLQNMPMDDFGKLVEAVNNMSKNLGVTLTAGTKEGAVTVQHLTVALDMEMLGKVAGDRIDELKKFTDLLGTKVEFALAYGPKKVSMAMGPNAVKTATEIANGSYAGGGQKILDMVGTAGMFMHLDAGAALAAFEPVVKAAGAGDKLPKIEPGTGGGFALAGTPTSVTFKLYGSLDKFVELGKQAMAANDDMRPEPAVEMKAENKEAAPAAEQKAEPAAEEKEAAPAEQDEDEDEDSDEETPE